MIAFILISIFKALVQNQDEIARIFFFVIEKHVMALSLSNHGVIDASYENHILCSLISNSLCGINFFSEKRKLASGFP
jgi:hypothetical protein